MLWSNLALRGGVLFEATGSNSRTNYNQAGGGVPLERYFIIDQQGNVALPYFGHDAAKAIAKIRELLGGDSGVEPKAWRFY